MQTLLGVVALSFVALCAAAPVLESEVRTLTLHKNTMTQARRIAPRPQLICHGLACDKHAPDTVQCTNVGTDGEHTQWKCEADMDKKLKFGRMDVQCEGYSKAGDPYVLSGSCNLEYELVSPPEMCFSDADCHRQGPCTRYFCNSNGLCSSEGCTVREHRVNWEPIKPQQQRQSDLSKGPGPGPGDFLKDVVNFFFIWVKNFLHFWNWLLVAVIMELEIFWAVVSSAGILLLAALALIYLVLLALNICRSLGSNPPEHIEVPPPAAALPAAPGPAPGFAEGLVAGGLGGVLLGAAATAAVAKPPSPPPAAAVHHHHHHPVETVYTVVQPRQRAKPSRTVLPDSDSSSDDERVTVGFASSRSSLGAGKEKKTGFASSKASL